jgi:hypothetical protein
MCDVLLPSKKFMHVSVFSVAPFDFVDSTEALAQEICKYILKLLKQKVVCKFSGRNL